jgi:hypothetical protein
VRFRSCLVANVPGYGKQGVKGAAGSGCQEANPDGYRDKIRKNFYMMCIS